MKELKKTEDCIKGRKDTALATQRIKETIMGLLLRIVIICFTYSLFVPFCEAQTISTTTLPPVPGRLLDVIQKENHPMLMGNSDLFREARRSMEKDLLQERGNELKQRLVGYYNPQSKWYLNNGPLSDRKDFHPALLTDYDFEFYTKVLCETLAFTGIEKERWAIDGLKREFLRLLDDILPESASREAAFGEEPFSERNTRLLALACLTYDLVFSRFSTLERHPLNNRINQIRAKLVLDCAATDPATLPSASRISRGTALGLATLLCISVYPNEWDKERRFSEQSFLPDLYQAIAYTFSGIQEMESQSPHIQAPLPQLETLLSIAIPWMESLKRFGYPYEIQQVFYNRIVNSLETHRIPNGNEIVQPLFSGEFNSPWIPQSHTIFTTIPDTFYDKKNDKDRMQQTFVPFAKANKNINSSTEGGSFNIPQSLRADDINIQRDGQKAMSLRESFERFGFPKKPVPVQMPTEQHVSNPDAGWVPPAGLTLPSAWGALYLLAERDDPQSSAGEIWEEQAIEIDSHPYMFLYYKDFPAKQKKAERSSELIQYPEIKATLLTTIVPQGNYLFASQAARATLMMPTYAADHESFLLSEGGNPWRWFHEIPATAVPAATGDVSLPDRAVSYAVESATPLQTSLFTYWETYSPSGRTFAVRRHLGGLGSGYTAIVHFPEPGKSVKPIEYLQFSIPENGDVVSTEDTPGFYKIHPSEAELPNRPMNMETWKIERRAERMGEVKKTVNGILNLLFSPDCVLSASPFVEGTIGKRLEVKLSEPYEPFFYLCADDMPGREIFQIKYGNIPMPGVRILEWKQGIEIVAVNTGDKIENAFVESDADFVVIMRDTSMKGIFYLMVNGSYLRCKFSPTQKEFSFLADTQKKKTTAAWSQRHLYTNSPPKNNSRFYAPEALGFDCPGFIIQYGQKAENCVVLESKAAPPKRP